MNQLAYLDVYNSLIRDFGGGCPVDKIEFVEKICATNNINVICEIGVYNGCFLLPVTLVNNNKKSYGIDPYEPYLQIDIEDSEIKIKAAELTLDKSRHNLVYDRLISNINRFNLNVEVIRERSNTAFEKFADNSIDILHIDGCHDYDAVKTDINLFFDKVKKNGYIIFDDTNWLSVKTAYTEFMDDHSEDVDFIRETPYWICIKKIG